MNFNNLKTEIASPKVAVIAGKTKTDFPNSCSARNDINHFRIIYRLHTV